MTGDQSGEEITRIDCYRQVRKSGMGRLESLYYGLMLYEFVQSPDIVGLSNPEKWRVTEGQVSAALITSDVAENVEDMV